MKIGLKPCRAFLLADACNNSSRERNAWRSLPTCDRMAEAHVRLSQMPIARMHKAMHGWYSAPHGCTTRRMHAHVWQLSTRITLAEKSCWMCRFPFHEINALICACVTSASIILPTLRSCSYFFAHCIFQTQGQVVRHKVPCVGVAAAQRCHQLSAGRWGQ